MLDLAVLDLAADLGDLEPVEVPERPRGPLDTVADGLGELADEVAAALPGQWQAIVAEAGWGSWAELRRAC